MLRVSTCQRQSFIFQNFLKFYEQIAASVYRHLNFEVLKAVLVASPGFLREEFLNYLMKDATEKGNKQILENRYVIIFIVMLIIPKASLAASCDSEF
jgi:stalled ribosome rescue protein Dom34